MGSKNVLKILMFNELDQSGSLVITHIRLPHLKKIIFKSQSWNRTF